MKYNWILSKAVIFKKEYTDCINKFSFWPTLNFCGNRVNIFPKLLSPFSFFLNQKFKVWINDYNGFASRQFRVTRSSEIDFDKWRKKKWNSNSAVSWNPIILGKERIAEKPNSFSSFFSSCFECILQSFLQRNFLLCLLNKNLFFTEK